MAATNAPFGTWDSPITSELIVSKAIGLATVALDGADIYWLESRPTESGRVVIVRRTPDGQTQDLIPAPFNARSRVHEYGGGAYTVSHEVVYFVNFIDQRIYRAAATPEPITPENAWRYADLQVDKRRQRLICVREDHSTSDQSAENTLVSVSLEEGEQVVLERGSDFFASPRLSPDGTQMAWLSWNHPNMPWDGTELWLGTFAPDGTIHEKIKIAGGINESIFQPQFAPDGTLYFVSDRSGWWNLYRWDGEKTGVVWAMEAEFGAPQWVFGQSTYAILSPTQIACCYNQNGLDYLAILDVSRMSFSPLDLPFTAISDVRGSPQRLVILAASAAQSYAVVEVDPSNGKQQTIKRSSEETIDPGYFSIPRPVEFPTTGGLTAHGLFYPPHNKDFTAPPDEKPPLLVFIHGGPTSATDTSLKLGIQFWTSRGFGVLDVNYGGSTGYGRPYRERLANAWGIVDVDDCANGALALARSGEADQNRLAIRGGSAGGYTTLAALTFRNVFKAGASHFGVSDLEALATDTHKFESRYLDKLVGPYPQAKHIYQERSPIHHTERLSVPVIFFQGLDDRVVPPNQAEKMVEALRQKGIPVAYLAYEGEGHGFRKAENIQRTLDAELYFYQRVFGIATNKDPEPVEIHNLPG